MSDVQKLTEAVERLTNICGHLLMLIQKNRIACDRPSADGYEGEWSDTKIGIENLELFLEGKP